MGRARHEEHEEHENHERWLVSYADMVTLLMVLFIVMFAISQVDEKKYSEVKAGLAAGFGNDAGVMAGSENILDQPGSSTVSPVAPVQLDLEGRSPTQAKEIADAVQVYEQQQRERRAASAAAEVDRLTDVQSRLAAALERRGLTDDVRTQVTDRGLVVSLVSRHVVFEPNVAELSARGRAVVDVLAPVLRDLPDPLSVDGHTNQVPGKPKFYDSDWDLSAARAVHVLRYLGGRWDVPEERMTATAHGHESPLVPPGRPGSQAVNKRVDIVVESAAPADVRALLDDVGSQQAGGAATAVVTTARQGARP